MDCCTKITSFHEFSYEDGKWITNNNPQNLTEKTNFMQIDMALRMMCKPHLIKDLYCTGFDVSDFDV